MKDELVIPLVAILMPLVLVPTVLILKFRQKRREWKHQERLRALDLGLPGGDFSTRLSGGSVVAIGAGVPIAAVLTSLIAMSSIPVSHPDYMPIIAITWGCSVVISIAALITSLVLGVMVMRSSKTAESVDTLAGFKPSFEPDAYDVVSRRG
jgi:hypothetical protein